MSCEITWPCVGHRKLVVDGVVVPHIALSDDIDGQPIPTKLLLDGWGWLLAQAMAVAAGYTSHGPNSRPINLYGGGEHPSGKCGGDATSIRIEDVHDCTDAKEMKSLDSVSASFNALAAG